MYFLLALVTDRLATLDVKERLALKTLVMPGGLGTTMKVLILGKGVGTPQAGRSVLSRARDMNPGALIGILVMVVSEGATLARVEPFYSWNTPIAWTGFILFADSVVWRARNSRGCVRARLSSRFSPLASIPLWLVFEFYNLYIENWYYTGLPTNFYLRQFGYAWSFATIWPAIFEAADLIDVWRAGAAWPRDGPKIPLRYRSRQPHIHDGRRRGHAALAAGLAIALPRCAGLARVHSAARSDQRVASARIRSSPTPRMPDYRRSINLILSGLLCGVLWEFWNYWAGAKWHYTVPIMEHTKVFEMPLPGYFGFPAFALECFTMYVFVRAIARRIIPNLAQQFRYSIAVTGPSRRLSRP